VVLTEQIAADHERLLGPDDPDVRALRAVLITRRHTGSARTPS
jgi:hypothetical protein